MKSYLDNLKEELDTIKSLAHDLLDRSRINYYDWNSDRTSGVVFFGPSNSWDRSSEYSHHAMRPVPGLMNARATHL